MHLKGWLLLLIAIILELSGTISMKYSAGFSKWIPSILMFVFYAASFTSLNFAIKTIDVSIAYAVWSGLGTVMITIIGIMYFDEHVTLYKVLAIVIIVSGVVMLNLAGAKGQDVQSSYGN